MMGWEDPKINPLEKKGNVAYFVLDRLVVHESKKKGPNGDILSSDGVASWKFLVLKPIFA